MIVAPMVRCKASLRDFHARSGSVSVVLVVIALIKSSGILCLRSHRGQLKGWTEISSHSYKGPSRLEVSRLVP